ncbi:hypothetical protein HNR25_004795 [Streptomonospora salina]|uniref:Uncharacterized protein n=1 Tax=Streptomonospora salina TaxID=104205 RepID=A0A841ED97_9ACTN|nr:hypothetical protein [Streptomonospora salina]
MRTEHDAARTADGCRAHRELVVRPTAAPRIEHYPISESPAGVALLSTVELTADNFNEVISANDFVIIGSGPNGAAHDTGSAPSSNRSRTSTRTRWPEPERRWASAPRHCTSRSSSRVWSRLRRWPWPCGVRGPGGVADTRMGGRPGGQRDRIPLAATGPQGTHALLGSLVDPSVTPGPVYPLTMPWPHSGVIGGPPLGATLMTGRSVAEAGALIWRGVGPAGVGTSASRVSSLSSAVCPSSAAARSSSLSGMDASMRWRFSFASRNCPFDESFGV